MEEREIAHYERFKECVDFHGHVCPGLAMGYRASLLALERLSERRADDEELVAIVENDSCFVDAVQVLTGCTFGKGNLLHRDYGKMAVVLVSRASGKGVRVSMREGSFRPQDNVEHITLLQKVIRGDADAEERKRFWELHEERSRGILNADSSTLFAVRDVTVALPPKAQIQPSEFCGLCGEPTMATKMVEVGGKKLCQSCAKETTR